MKPRLFAAFLALVPALGLWAQPSAPPGQQPADLQRLGDELNQTVLRQTLGDWWGEVVVVQNGKPVLAQGYGIANETLAPMTVDSLVDVGDLSKQFTAAAVLRLEQMGKLSIDDPITKFFPGAPEAVKAVTLRHILSHTSGLSDRSPVEGGVDDNDRDKLALAILGSGLQHEPGAVLEYCNRAYSVAAAVVEIAAGKPFDQFMREDIFKPAGLTSTGFIDGVGLDKEHRTQRMTSIRVNAPKGPLFAPANAGAWTWARRGTTGVVSCARDLARWDAVLRTDVLLNEAEREKMRTPVQESYGLAIYNQTTSRNTRRLWHGGSSPGYKTLMVTLLDEGTSFIVITNDFGEPDSMINLLEEALYPALPEKATATLYFQGLVYNQQEATYTLDEAVRWVANPGNDGGVQLSMYRAANGLMIASMTLSEGTARRVLANLNDILRFTKETADKPLPTMTAITLPKHAAPENAMMDFPQINRIEMRSAYRTKNADGTELMDRRPTLIVVEAGGTIPLVVRMEKASGEQLSQVMTQSLSGSGTRPAHPNTR